MYFCKLCKVNSGKYGEETEKKNKKTRDKHIPVPYGLMFCFLSQSGFPPPVR